MPAEQDGEDVKSSGRSTVYQIQVGKQLQKRRKIKCLGASGLKDLFWAA